MNLKNALGKVGVQIVKTEQNKPGQAVLYLRVNPKMGSFWNEALTEFLLASSTPAWAADVSKWFYPVPDQGVVKYLWRVVLTKDMTAAAEALGRACVRAVASSVEVTSQPLVGRKEFEYDPVNGKIAGPHSTNQGARLLAHAASRS